jgi:hypothetical protein
MTIRLRKVLETLRYDPANEGWWTKDGKFIPLDFIERAAEEAMCGNYVPMINRIADATGMDVQQLYFDIYGACSGP